MSYTNEVPDIVPRTEQTPEIDRNDHEHPEMGNVDNLDDFLDKQKEKDEERDNKQ